MMTDRQLIDKFLELQEQADCMTDEQLRQALNDEQMRELAEQMAFAKRAFKNEDMQTAIPSVDEEWAKFAASHSEKQKTRGRAYKIAASFVGILLVSGIAIAAINLMRSESTPAKTEQVQSATPPMLATPLTSDTIATEPRIFDNVSLEKILTEIAATHKVSVEFQSEDTRQLRFHFVWKREDGLQRTVEKLNTFEAVDIVIENKKLIVR